MLFRNFSLVCACFCALSGCKTDDLNDSEILAINDFYISGTNDNQPDEIAEIDPYMEFGEFEVIVKLAKPDLGYELAVYFNEQQTLSDSALLYALECTNDDDFCYQPDYYTVACSFNPDLTGDCLGQSFNLSSQLPQLPFTGYLLVEYCHRIQNRCVVDSQRVIIR